MSEEQSASWIGTVFVESTEALPVSLVETVSFAADVKKLLSERDLAELKFRLALEPLVGEVIPGSGGIRKIRWALPGHGKRGGARVIYYYHDREMPIFLLAAYAKNARINLSDNERNILRGLVNVLIEAYRGG